MVGHMVSLNNQKKQSNIMTWYAVMNRFRVSAQAVARTILRNYEPVKPLDKQEAEQVFLALENSGVQDAATRLNATWSRILLKAIT